MVEVGGGERGRLLRGTRVAWRAWVWQNWRVLINGKCHCGNIRFALTWEADEIPARACSCSFCRKHGGVWTSHPDAALRVEIAEPERVSRYAFGTGTAEFHVCGRCGVVPVVTSRIDGNDYAVVSVNALEGIDPSRLRHVTSDVEGEDTVARLARRRRNWIARVEIVEGPARTAAPAR